MLPVLGWNDENWGEKERNQNGMSLQDTESIQKRSQHMAEMEDARRDWLRNHRWDGVEGWTDL